MCVYDLKLLDESTTAAIDEVAQEHLSFLEASTLKYSARQAFPTPGNC
jgi:hypothetical protein